MSNLKDKSSAPAEKNKKQALKKINVDWHKAVSCALQIDLRDYSHLLEFITEYILKDGNYRIDLLLIKKLTDELIKKTEN